MTPTTQSVVVPERAMEQIAFNLCSLHDFDPAFVSGQERFARAVITEYLRAAPAPSSLAGGELERAARLIDPKAWKFADKFSTGPHAETMRAEVKCETAASLRIAGEVLAALSPEAPAREGVKLICVVGDGGFTTLHEPDEDGGAGDLVASVWRDDYLPRLVDELSPSVAWACTACNSPRAVNPCQKCGTELTKPADGWDWPRLPDIDRIRELAREVGYAVGVHGTLERDLDLIAVPWIAEAVTPFELAQHIASGLGGNVLDYKTQDKPCGRWSCNINSDGWFKLIDLSVMTPALTPRHEAPASEGERFTADQAWADLLEKADRNSPEDSPMLLITWEEMADYMDRAQSDAKHEAPAEGAGERVYIDCEFDGHNGPLLSVALVRESGDSIHIRADVEPMDLWVRQNVLPLMDSHKAARSEKVYAYEVGGVIRSFLGEGSPVIVCDSPQDARYFSQALTTAPDGGYAPFPFDGLTIEVLGVDAYPTTLEGAVQHNAWWDAMALREALRARSSAPEAREVSE